MCKYPENFSDILSVLCYDKNVEVRSFIGDDIRVVRNKTSLIHVQDVPVSVISMNQDDYICITDMAKARTDAARAADVIKNWLRNRSTLEFLETWEMMYNPDFKVVEFDHFKMESGLNTFVISVSEWIEKTSAIGMYVKAGHYGGTYAQKDIAFEFGSSWGLESESMG